ncbi:MAG: phosphoglycerate dehydrogenase, partial [Chloroflexi bacterium]|nr:phosphoglycerate dehydrogenase [Chloroflexota bacterium]
MRVLVTDPIAQDGIDAFLAADSVTVDVRLGLKGDALLEAIPDYAALVVRSETKVTAEVLRAGRRLQVVGRAGVGVDNIDVETATQLGIVVVYAPTGNTFSAAELAVGLMMSLARHIPQAHGLLKQGQWRRQDFVGIEVRHKVLGVIGLGRVGAAVARRAVGLEMRVVAFDPFVSLEYARAMGVEVVSMDELLRMSDFISVHTPLTQGTRGLIGEEELRKVKPGVRLINTARGGIIEEEALARAVEDGRVAGAAVDVFTQEPITADNPLLKSNRIILTPHLGASTEEAQTNVAIDVAEQVLAVLDGRPVRYAVNAPLIAAETMTVIGPATGIARILGRLARQLAPGQPASLQISYDGEIATFDTTPLKAAVLGGMLEGVTEERVTLVNAHLAAQQRGLRVTEVKNATSEDAVIPSVTV